MIVKKKSRNQVAPKGTATKAKPEKAKKKRLTRAEKKERAEAKEKELLAQHKVPLKTIEGPFMIRPDGKMVALIWLEGTNDSLYTYSQKKDEANKLAAALRGVNVPIAILKYPKSIDSNAHLVMIDKQLAELRREIQEENISDYNDAKMIRLRILEQHLRPEAEHEALSGNRIMHPCYMAFEFDPKIGTRKALQDLNTFVKRLNDMDRKARILNREQTIEVLQLFFLYKNIDLRADEGRTAVMPAV